jgi:hypothetical protein
LERDHHCEQAFQLAKEIRKYCLEQQHKAQTAASNSECEADRLKYEKKSEAWKDINVKCFLMDLQGNVEHLVEPPATTAAATNESVQEKA